ncbi:hypothetical protein [Nocardia pseudovaccinii]|nr:hypothetical protein [Nocardia pseudovaccinii]
MKVSKHVVISVSAVVALAAAAGTVNAAPRPDTALATSTTRATVGTLLE